MEAEWIPNYLGIIVADRADGFQPEVRYVLWSSKQVLIASQIKRDSHGKEKSSANYSRVADGRTTSALKRGRQRVMI
jgi:hypothetical protein